MKGLDLVKSLGMQCGECGGSLVYDGLKAEIVCIRCGVTYRKDIPKERQIEILERLSKTTKLTQEQEKQLRSLSLALKNETQKASDVSSKFEVFGDVIVAKGFCPRCGNNNPTLFTKDFPQADFDQCNVCKNSYDRKYLFIVAKPVEAKAVIVPQCPKCNSPFNEITTKVTFEYWLYRFHCYECEQIFWYAEKRAPLFKAINETMLKSSQKVSAYSRYRERYYATVNAPPRWNAHKKEVGRAITTIREPYIVKGEFKQRYKRVEPQSIGYTKKERIQYSFEKESRFKDSLLKSLEYKLYKHNKRGKTWAYLATAIIHIGDFIKMKNGEARIDDDDLNPTEFIDDLDGESFVMNLPEIYSRYTHKPFKWKTYWDNLRWVVERTQPYVIQGRRIKKQPDVWVQVLRIWIEDQPTK